MEKYQNALSKQKEYETLKHQNEIVGLIKYNCQPLIKYVKSKAKIHKNVSTVKNDKIGKLTDTQVETAMVQARYFQFVHSFKDCNPLQESYYEKVQKIMDELKNES